MHLKFMFDYGDLPRELEIQLANNIGAKIKELLDGKAVKDFGLLQMGDDRYPLFKKPSVIFNF